MRQPNKRLKLTARVYYGMNRSSARRSLGAIRQAAACNLCPASARLTHDPLVIAHHVLGDCPMRLRSLLTLILLAAGPQLVRAQSHDDSLGIRDAALDYIAGWYSADGDRMAEALQPELAKRIM